MSMKLSYFSYTNKGGRPNNEDSLRCQELDGRGVFVLADGLGGHQSGETASAIAVEAILAGASAAPSLDGGTLLSQLAEANRQVMEGQKEPGCEDMKTTAVVLGIETSPEDGALSDGSVSSGEGRAAWAHVGDSRLYYFAGGELAAVTRDHSVTYMKYLGGEISYMDVYHDDDRASLLRVLGRPGCRPETGEAAVRPGDAFLLCSDGFWEFVYNEEMQADLLKSETPAAWVQSMLLRHIRRTPPGNDNLSVIAVFVEE